MLNISCESSAQQMIHMKRETLFSLKNNIKKKYVNRSCVWNSTVKIRIKEN